MIFVSYHNIDAAYAFQLATLLIRYYRKAWLDRYEIEPAADWQQGIRDARAQATDVIAVVSDDYLRSSYCLSEFEYFRERNIAVTAVIARDFSTDEIASFSFSDWVDFRRWFDDPNDLSVENLLAQFPQSESVAQTGERADYLRTFIQDSELALSKMPTAWAAMRNAASTRASQIRPRMLNMSLLRDWDFSEIKAGKALPLSDLQAWAETETRFKLSGDPGSGKTSLARLLALAQAHLALRDEDAAAPIWFDMAQWDDTVESIGTFVEANWPLLTYWQHWLETQSSFIVLDNWSDFRGTYPGRVAEVTEWIDSNPHLGIVLLTDCPSRGDPTLPTLRLNGMSMSLAQKFAGGVLTLEQQSSFKPLLRLKSALIADSPLAYLAIGLELHSADRALAHNQWQENPLPALLRLRGQQLPALTFGVRIEDVHSRLEELAWLMMQLDRPRFVTYELARETVGDARVIEYALAIGILVVSGPRLRFESELLQLYLAAETLKRDGLVKYLARPAFDANMGRAPQKWDRLALLMVDSLSDDNRPRIIGNIADIDPLLACMCLKRHPAVYDSCRESLIQTLVDLCAKNAAARSAFRNAIAQLAPPENTAETLIGQMSRLNNKLQLWLWYEIGALPLELPVDFIERIADIDRGGVYSAADQLAPYSLWRGVAYLVKLSLSDHANVRRNAIWLLGELKYLPTAILLLDLLNKADQDDIDTILRALMNYAYSEILARVLRWSQDNPSHRASVLAALSARKRWVTSRLLSLADANRLTLEPEFYDIVVETGERDIAIGLAKIARDYVDLPETIETTLHTVGIVTEENQRLASAIKHLPNREGFQQLLQDIVKVLQDPPESTIIAGSNIDALLYGTPVFDGVKAQLETSSAGGRSNEIVAQLRHSDWRQRHKAVNQLINSSADDSLPLLLEATADTDNRVRLAAYRILSQFDTEPAAEKAVVAALSDPDIALVKALTELLQGMTLRDFDVLYDLLESVNPATVAAAISILGGSSQRQAISELRPLMNDSRQPAQGGPSIGQRARAAIGSLEASVIANDDSGRIGDHDKFSDEEKIRRTLRVLRDDDWGRTQKAAKFLRKFARHLRGRGSFEVRQLLCDALSDQNWSVRWAAVEALAVLRDPAAASSIRELLGDSSWIVLVAAVRALVELKATDSAAQVLPLLQHRQPQVREAAAEALGNFKSLQATQALAHSLKHEPNDFIRLAALKSICQLDADDLRSWLELALSDSYLHIRLFAMHRLSPDMDDSDLPILQKLLHDSEAPSFESESLRDLAIRTLRRIDSDACRALLASLSAVEDRTSA